MLIERRRILAALKNASIRVVYFETYHILDKSIDKSVRVNLVKFLVIE
jgi:hypothetical protein